MSITPKCDKCQQELTEYGGLLFTPPDEESKVIKYHLCADCCKVIEFDLKIKTGD